MFVKACFGAMSFGWDSSVIGGVIVLPPFVKYAGLECTGLSACY